MNLKTANIPGLKKLFLLSCLLCITFKSIAQSQSPRYLFKSYGTRDGLLSPKLYGLFQDKKGFLWIGSDIGVSRYNGYEFENYQYTNDNLPIGKITCFAEDKENGIWMGGERGLFYLKNDSLIKLRKNHIPDFSIECLVLDKQSNLWIGELNGLFKLTAAEISKLNLRLPVYNFSRFDNFKERVFTTSLGDDGNVYGGTYDAIFMVANGDSKIVEIWKNNEPSNYIRSIEALSKDEIYFNRYDGQPTVLRHNKPIEFSSTTDVGQVIFKKNNTVYALTTTGVRSLTQATTPLFSHIAVTNNVTAGLVDRENNFWVASWEGLLKYRPNSFTKYELTGTQQTEIFSMYEDENNQLFFGANRGLLFTKKLDKLSISDLSPVFKSAEVFSIHYEPGHSTWFGSGYQGISRLKNGVITNWNESNGLVDNTCDAFFRSSDGQLYACTEKGVTVINWKEENAITNHYGYAIKQSRFSKLLGGFQGDDKKNYFYGGQGLFTVRNKQLVQDSISGFATIHLGINKIIRDKQQNVWVATQGKGILKCTERKGRIILEKQFTRDHGLPSDVVLSAVVDKNDRIWLGFHQGIALFSPPANFIFFNENDGLLDVNYQDLKLVSESSGKIWGLTSMGAFTLHPDSLAISDVAPGIMLTHVSLNHSGENISGRNRMKFSHTENSFQFTYTGVYLTDARKLIYKYRVLGIDSTWLETSNREIDFNYLNPGNYTFQVMACNSTLNCSDIAEFHFKIDSPFWQKWWFITTIILSSLSVLLLIGRNRSRALVKENKIKQEMAELKGKALRAQMNPHFIFNSLNAIQECIVTEKIDSAYEYLSRFSRLLRMVLNHSEKNFITLSSELETLKLYLSLESLRFRGSFSYDIQIEEGLDIDEVIVPSLLLQPYVENAIWHGLINKEGEKKLQISFAQVGHSLICKISDNGIGRMKAAEIKANKLGAGKFDSKGTALSIQRIKTLNQQFSAMSSINTVDEYDSSKNPSGTTIIITLPIDLTELNKQQ